MKYQNLRHEYKHMISEGDCLQLRQRLTGIAKPDPHAKNGKYRIRSLYFDNIDDKVLKEKILGLSNREKFRIRYYNNDFSYIKLEKKSKVKGLCKKDAVRVTKEECECILNGDIDWMLLDDSRPLLWELHAKMRYQQLRPATVVDYLREPFVYGPGNVRVTLDSEIRTGLKSDDLFNQNLSSVPISDPNARILEVKYDAFLPDVIRDAVQVENRMVGTFSKYAACRCYL